MVEPGGTGRGRRTTRTLPGVQTNMMMIAAGRKEGRLASIPLRELKPEHIPIKRERTLQVSHLQVDMANPRFRGNRPKFGILFHMLNLPQVASA